MRYRLSRLFIPFCLVIVTIQAAAKPLLVLMDFDAWFPSSGPGLVIYDDGVIIYQSPKEILIRRRHDYTWVKSFCYMTSHVPDSAAFINRLFPYNWAALKPKYTLSAATDQVTTLLWHSGQIIEIYGDWRRFLEPGDDGDSDPVRSIVESENALRQSLPRTFRGFLQGLDRFSDPQAQMWLPEIVNISLYKYTRPVNSPIVWPTDFPRPTNFRHGPVPEIVETGIALPAQYYLKLRTLLSQTVYPGTVSIDGENYVVSEFTFPFPGEETWKRDLALKREREKQEMLKEIEKLPPDKRKEIKKLLGL